MMKRAVKGCFAGLCAFALAQGAWAHSISFIRGEAVVHTNRVELSVDVRPEDILLSAGMSLIVVDRIEGADFSKGLEERRKLLLQGLVISDAEGHRLTGVVTRTEAPAIPAGGIPLDDLMATSVLYRLEYPLAQPPTRLSFVQHFNSETFSMPVVMELTVNRAGQADGATIPVPDGDQPETIAFDWAATASAVAAAPAPRPVSRQETEAYLYILNEEVRVEVLMPLATVELWQAVPRAKPELLEIAEQAAAQEALAKWFTSLNELKIDRATVKPVLERLDFYGLDYKDFATRPQPQRVSTAALRVGAILTYSTKGAPRRVELKWTLFDPQAPTVRTVVFAYDKGSRSQLRPEQSVFAWENPGVPALPKIEAVRAGAGAHDAAARAALAETLLRNVYRGFDYRAESDIYDALAQSVHGALLTDLYLKIKQGLTVQEQGGAVARVQQVRVTQVAPAAGSVPSGFAVNVTWQVEGTVEHWGHIHTRVNEYTADLGIAPQDGEWKLVSMDVTKQNQVKSSMSLRPL